MVETMGDMKGKTPLKATTTFSSTTKVTKESIVA